MNQSIKEYFASIKNDIAIMLSYGEDNEITPVGSFYLKDVLDNNEKTGLERYSLLFEGIKLDNNNISIDSTSKVIVPLDKFLKILLSMSGRNSSDLRSFIGSNTDVRPEVITILESELEKLLENKSGLKYEALTEPLSELDAEYYTNNELRSDNYSIVPFSLGRVLQKVLTLTPDYSEREDSYYSKIYDYMDDENTKSHGRSR